MNKIVILPKNEYDYLINVLLKKHEEIISHLNINMQDNNVIIELRKETSDDIRELASDIVALHFDKNYNPTDEGVTLEHLIDLFFTE